MKIELNAKKNKNFSTKNLYFRKKFIIFILDLKIVN